VYVSGDYGGGSIVVAGDGTMKRLNSPPQWTQWPAGRRAQRMAGECDQWRTNN
jgi:hypothetical protein